MRALALVVALLTSRRQPGWRRAAWVSGLAFFAVSASGKQLTERFNCVSCHGPALMGLQHIPRLAGQQYDYLVQALTDYRTGVRDNAVMSAMAKPLTEKEIRDLAGYFSRQQGLTTKR